MAFRKSQSLPLGGAIPSAASPEEEETLEHRETVQGTGLFFFSRHVTKKKQNTASASATVLLRNIPEFPLCFNKWLLFYTYICVMLKPSPFIWMSSAFSASHQLFIISLCSCNSQSSSFILMPRSCSSTYLSCWSCAISHGAHRYNFPLMCGPLERWLR